MEVDQTEPSGPARGVPRRWPWHGLAGRVTFGIASASGRRGIVGGGLALVAIGTLLWALGLTGLWPALDRLGLADWPQWPHLLTLLGAVLAVVLFRYRPAAALVLGATAVLADAVLGGSLGVLVAMWELLFCVGMLGSARMRQVVNGTVTCVVVAGSVGAFLTEADLSRAVVLGLQLIAVLALPLWWAATVRQRTELGDLAAQRADLEAERADLQTRRVADLERIGELRRSEAVQAERSAIARDLHDAIASRLTTIAIHSAGTLAAPGRDQGEPMRAVRAQALEALQEMRSLIVVLRSEPDRTPTSRTAAVVVRDLGQITELVDTARASGLRVRLDLPAGSGGLAATVPVAVAQAAYRIVQEALANAAKHAPESDVTVSVSVPDEGGEVRVVVENSVTTAAGVGHPALSAGTGLITMRERAESLGGRLAAEPDETAAVWQVAASLPLPGSEERAGSTR